MIKVLKKKWKFKVNYTNNVLLFSEISRAEEKLYVMVT